MSATRLGEPPRSRRSRWSLGSLQGRLLWSSVFVMVLALVTLGLHAVSDASRQLQQEGSARLRALARGVALTLVNPLLTQQLDQVEESLLRLVLLPGLRELRVTDLQGQIISQVSHSAGGEPVLRFDATAPLDLPRERQPTLAETRLPDGTLALVAWHPVGGGSPVGWIQAVQTRDEVEALQRDVIVHMLVTGLGAALLGSLILIWLLRAPLASLRRAGRFALQLRQVDGSQMAVDPHAPLEMRELMDALNSTSTRLAEQAQAIEQAMATVQQHGEALDQRNRELDAILSISPNGLLALDAQGLVRFASAAIGRFTGLDPQSLVGQPLASFEHLLRERCGAPADWPGFEAELSVPRSAHAGKPLLTLLQPARVELRLERGQLDTAGITSLISVQDVTHEREVERLKSEFLSTAAHELRTPMVSVHGFTELMLHRQMPPERQRTMLEAIHRNSTLMNHVINELLDLSRIEARRGVDFEREAIDLQVMVQRAVADFRTPEGRDPPLVEAVANPLPAWADPGKLRQVLFNLLSNAYKYSSAPGRVTVELLFDADDPQAPPDRVGFAVTDEGIGMSPDQLARVFERFYRADPSGSVLGTGLGMPIVQEIVHLHGGQVLMASQPGKGSTATVWLPRRNPAPALPSQAASTA